MEPFEFAFMRRAMLAATLVGVLTASVGVFVVLRRLSYIGHGLAHSIFGGAVVSFVAGINFYVGATIWGAFSVLLINGASRRRQISGDAAIGIITTAAFAVGVALISRERTFTRDFEAALFGEVLGISNSDVWVIGGTMLLVAGLLFVWWKQLLFVTFDRDVAGASGVSLVWVEVVFSLVLAATVIASLQVLGVTLIAAALVIPPVTARLLTDSFPRLFVLATVTGGLTGFLGIYLSWFVDVSSGATVVLLQAAIFALVLGATSVRSRLREREARRRAQGDPAEALAGIERSLFG
ncbi:MAG: manganese/iron transport system permease protein/iron/zinc/copper transport system permease protein [Chloroflexi bacterium]|nr:MAG: manganese/iron transport system permease protein/iron/zinc/copper transport system permease protein [Chloroflexota bacterium]